MHRCLCSFLIRRDDVTNFKPSSSATRLSCLLTTAQFSRDPLSFFLLFGIITESYCIYLYLKTIGMFLRRLSALETSSFLLSLLLPGGWVYAMVSPATSKNPHAHFSGRFTAGITQPVTLYKNGNHHVCHSSVVSFSRELLGSFHQKSKLTFQIVLHYCRSVACPMEKKKKYWRWDWLVQSVFLDPIFTKC
jgi:hypothetical protein